MKTKHAGKYRSDAFAAIHEAAEALHHVGAINKVTMREFDDTCLEVVQEIKPSQIRACVSASMFHSRFCPVTERVKKLVSIGTRQEKAVAARREAPERNLKTRHRNHY